MKASRTLILSAFLTMTLGACIEDKGTEEVQVGTPTTTPPDFDVAGETPTETPPTPGDTGTMPPTEPPEDIEEGFLINGGAAKTASTTVELELVTLNRYQMRISPTSNCEDGTWIPWVSKLTVRLPAENERVTLSVQYKDWDNRVGRCYRQTILHDSVGPQILFTRYPAPALEEGSTANIVAEIADAVGQVESATCSLNGVSKSCFPGRNEVSVTALPPGDYVFEIKAVDDLGNESSASVAWTVNSFGRHLRQNITVNDYRKVDILMVIDNSGSMEYEQQSMAQRTSQMLSILRGLDYQIAVTTTDPRNVTLGDGRFIPIHGMNGETILNTSVPEETAQFRLGKTLQRSEMGSGSEQGIYATYRVLDRYVANEGNARRFFRDGAQFAVILISDEDESDNTYRNDPHRLLQKIHDTFGGQKRFGFHSIITKPGDKQCRNTHGYAYGERYKIISELTGGVIGSVCEMDYSNQVRGISEGVRDLLKTLTLSCEPIDRIPIKVKRDGIEVTGSYRVDGVNLKFETELVPGDYTVEYGCLPN